MPLPDDLKDPGKLITIWAIHHMQCKIGTHCRRTAGTISAEASTRGSRSSIILPEALIPENIGEIR